MIALPVQEGQGMRAFDAGFTQRRASWPLGFAFCPYKISTPEHESWVAGYAEYAFAGDGQDTAEQLAA